ncbi:MAG: GNAT family N-acetyltransferase, partial [Solirubrobacteraceae bacterium]
MKTAAAPREAYPSAHVVDVALKDGSSLHIRPVAASDSEAVRGFLEGLSKESIGFRFFGSPNLDWVCNWSVDVDYSDRYALIASTGAGGEIVAHGAYMRLDEHRAEVAFVVSDAWQGLGIATIMLAHLAAAAAEHGIGSFFAEVLPHNHRMIEVFAQSGFPLTRHRTRDAIEVELPTSISAQTAEHFEQRDRVAAVAALRGFLAPRSVAVIGASRRRQTIGGELWHNLAQNGFTGEAYPVNEKADEVQGARAYRAIDDVPGSVDLAVIATPAERVAEAARQCARAGVRSLLVISGGFGETGGEGVERQRELLDICRESGMRLIGPNCLGVLNTAACVNLNATFAAGKPRPGSVGFLSQSGGLGIAIIQGAERFGIGLSSFVSVGDKADISGNDLLQYWEQDPNTSVILLYLESFGNPRRFARIARRVSAHKPIIAVKSGRSTAGARAGASHTGALVATSDVTVDALFDQAGVIRTDTVHEQFDVAALLACQPVPKGGRVAIVTNAGGPGILCADACQAGDLDVVELPAKLRKRLSGFLDRHASLANPVDMIAGATGEDYRLTIEALASAGVCDAILAIFVPPLVTEAADVAAAIHTAAANAGDVSVAAVFMTGEAAPAELASDASPIQPIGDTRSARAAGNDRRVPAFEFPEDAARALAHAARYG